MNILEAFNALRDRHPKHTVTLGVDLTNDPLMCDGDWVRVRWCASVKSGKGAALDKWGFGASPATALAALESILANDGVEVAVAATACLPSAN